MENRAIKTKKDCDILYIIKCKDDLLNLPEGKSLCKIGVTYDVDRRMKAFLTHSPLLVECECFIKTGQAKQYEQILLWLFQE